MPHITIHLDDEVLESVKAASKGAGVSPSQWIADTIRRRAKSEWPVSVLAIAGAWPDFPTANEIRKSQRAELPRKRI